MVQSLKLAKGKFLCKVHHLNIYIYIYIYLFIEEEGKLATKQPLEL